MTRSSVAFVLALLALGCGRSSVTAVVAYPAAMPLRVYPVVLVAFGSEPTGAEAAARVEQHLRQAVGDSPAVDARIMPRESVEQLITAGALQPGTAVVDVASAASVRVTTVPRTINYQDCSFGRCVSRMRTDYVDEAVTVLAVTLAVRDIRTGRVIHRVREAADLIGAGPRAERSLMGRVMSALLPYLDQRTERVRLRLLSVSEPRVERALDLLREGEWRAARVLLEEAVRSPEVAALPAEDRARALYDLSVARRFDPTTTDDVARHYASAAAPLEAALALDPDRSFYRDALTALRTDEARAAALAAQYEVARANATASAAPTMPSGPRPEPPPADAPAEAEQDAPTGDVPPPPPGYR